MRRTRNSVDVMLIPDTSGRNDTNDHSRPGNIYDMMYHDVKKDAKKYGHNRNDIFSSCISLCYDIFSSSLFVILGHIVSYSAILYQLYHIMP